MLDDLYIRFFRLAERCIGERADYGVVSFISNYSFYTGRSHPLMRSCLINSFDEIWIDCLNGDKYKTGKVIPKGLPGEGTTDQSIFTTEHDPRGIQVGTGITTLLKRRDHGRTDRAPLVHYRNYWGRSKGKRDALLATFHRVDWSEEKQVAVAQTPEGPRLFGTFEPSGQSRWKLVPFSAQGGFDDWPALDQLFTMKVQGVNPNRGIQGTVVEINKKDLEDRMRDYFSKKPHKELRVSYPFLYESYAGYEAEKVRDNLCKSVQFEPSRLVPYVIFPLDVRWLYYETRGKLLNRPRPELYDNLADNEFLVTVPEPRKESETRPIMLTTAFDLHLHDRGSVCFPTETIVAGAAEGTLFTSSNGATERQSNLAPGVWASLKHAFHLQGDLSGEDARSLSRQLARVSMALCHSPQYQAEHKDSLAQDWAHVPIPKSRPVFDELVSAGERLAILVNPIASPSKVLKTILGDDLKHLAIPSKNGAKSLDESDLLVKYSFFGGATGGWRSRPALDAEPMQDVWGNVTGDLYINDAVLFRHVPESIWRYELGGYPVIKKWLGYRDHGRRPDTPLTMPETEHLRGIVHRLAAILRQHSVLDKLYEQACKDCFSVEELGL